LTGFSTILMVRKITLQSTQLGKSGLITSFYARVRDSASTSDTVSTLSLSPSFSPPTALSIGNSEGSHSQAISSTSISHLSSSTGNSEGSHSQTISSTSIPHLSSSRNDCSDAKAEDRVNILSANRTGGGGLCPLIS
jgi:hypothetical protein